MNFKKFKNIYNLGAKLTDEQWRSISDEFQKDVIEELTIADIQKYRPDIYQEIFEDVLMGSFAGRTDEVFDIVVPAINEMLSEIADVTEQLKHSLESIVEKEARARFRKLLQDIEKATVYRKQWRNKEKKTIIADYLNSLEKPTGTPTKIKASRDSYYAKVYKKPNKKIEAHNNIQRPKSTNTTNMHTEGIRVGDMVDWHGCEVQVVDIIAKYGIRRLVVKNSWGDKMTINNYDVRKI